MPTPLHQETTQELLQRIDRLNADSKALWGSMSVTQMLAHSSTALKMAMGEIPIQVKFSPLKAAMAKFLFIKVFPFPKNIPTAPELDSNKGLRPTHSFEEEKALLVSMIQRLNALPADHDFSLHPIFRKMNRREWGMLTYKHVSHHLKQFGV
jgi:Protein of unknown function (DUF1569)